MEYNPLHLTGLWWRQAFVKQSMSSMRVMRLWCDCTLIRNYFKVPNICTAEMALKPVRIIGALEYMTKNVSYIPLCIEFSFSPQCWSVS